MPWNNLDISVHNHSVDAAKDMAVLCGTVKSTL